VSLDSLELQLASALQRYNTLQRRADTGRDAASLLDRTLAELGTALEQVRVAQEQLVESRSRMEALQEELRQQAAKYWQLFDEIPQPYLVTKVDSTILEVNRAAAELLNVSQRFLVGKTLSLFVCENRGIFLTTCTRVAEQGGRTQIALKVRPRERAPLDVSARLVGADGHLRWLLSAASESA
jgi:PAS domain-containing protein